MCCCAAVLLCDDVMVTMRHKIVELPAEKQIKCPEVVGSRWDG